MNARERILAKLHSAAPAEVPVVPDVAGYYCGRQATSLADRVHMFKAQMAHVHGEVVIAPAAEWPQVAAAQLAARGVRRLLFDAESAPGAALLHALPAAIALAQFEHPIGEWKAELFESVDAGFTVADAGIAATGTLVLRSGPRSPRSTSLVPPLHLALLRAETLYPDMHAAALGERWSAAMPSNLIFVSGPSKTSDIQQTVAYGAHGPRRLIVVIAMPDDGAGERR